MRRSRAMTLTLMDMTVFGTDKFSVVQALWIFVTNLSLFLTSRSSGFMGVEAPIHKESESIFGRCCPQELEYSGSGRQTVRAQLQYGRDQNTTVSSIKTCCIWNLYIRYFQAVSKEYRKDIAVGEYTQNVKASLPNPFPPSAA